MLENPCTRDCERRSGTCHSECIDYIIWRAFKDVERDERNKDKQTQYDINGTYHFAKKQKRRRPYADNRYGR